MSFSEDPMQGGMGADEDPSAAGMAPEDADEDPSQGTERGGTALEDPSQGLEGGADDDPSDPEEAAGADPSAPA